MSDEERWQEYHDEGMIWSLDHLQYYCWAIAEESGWHEEPRNRATILALFHSEVSEALEADREGDESGYREELADIVIRVLDHAETEGIDMVEEINKKCRKNAARDYRHGGKEY